MDWNPNNKRYLYFHFTTHDGRNEYLKIDSREHKVYKVTVSSGSKAGRPYMQGFYELKWITFISNYLHYGDEAKNRTIERRYGKSEYYRELKYTTENQYLFALRDTLIKFTKT
jgi:hypothetical protein